jgi:hypothetical protein
MRHNESHRREVGMAKHPLIGYLIWLVLFGAALSWLTERRRRSGARVRADDLRRGR